MVVIENDCCDCATDNYPCLGSLCSLRNAPHYYCDECGEEVDSGELYWFDDEQLCEHCIIGRLEIVKYEC